MILRFMFRCGQCREICSLKVQWVNRAPAPVRCTHCGATYSLPYDASRDPSRPTYRQEIHRLAATFKLDPASACSVREKIMTLDQAKSRGRAMAGKPRAARQKAASGMGRQVMIGAGLVLIAIASTAIPWQRAGTPPAAEAAPRPARVEKREPEPMPPAEYHAPLNFSTDPMGELTRIWGPDPRSVLMALCEHPQTRSRMAAAFIAPGRPPGPAIRVGLVRDLADFGALRALTIRRDSRTGRWYAGNGSEPITLERQETVPAGADPV
ncbi:MAG: hypothetical protein ACREAA_10260 [Candidatus Polarisedimenticolia bacterium]